MNDNPYAPPRSVVASVERRPVGERPARASLAVRLLYATIPLIAASLAYDFNGLVGEVLVYAAYTLFLVWLYVSIGRGRNWARVTFLILTVLSVLAMADHIPELRRDPVWHFVLDGVVMAVEFVAAFLLISGSSRLWFRRVD